MPLAILCRALSSARLERQTLNLRVAGSNPAGPTLRSRCDLPEVAVGVAEVAEVAPLRPFRSLHHARACGDGLGHDLVDGFLRRHDVVERDAAVPGPFRGHARILRRGLSLVQRERRGAVAQRELHEARIVLVDRAAQPFVEGLGPAEILDAQHDRRDLYTHGQLLSWVGSFPVIALDEREAANVTSATTPYRPTAVAMIAKLGGTFGIR